MLNPNIEGGYYLKAKCIQNADIAHAPPHVREIWDYLLLKAMFKDGEFLKKGQVLTTYDEIRQGLSWYIGWRKMTYSKWDCEKAMKLLTKMEMITTKKTTKGLIITICKYCLYQDVKNYESHTASHRKATGKPQTTDTIEKEVKEVIKKEERIKKIYGQYVELFEDEHKKLIEKFGQAKTDDFLEYFNLKIASKGLTEWRKEHKSDYHTILFWERSGYIKLNISTAQPELPQNYIDPETRKAMREHPWDYDENGKRIEK